MLSVSVPDIAAVIPNALVSLTDILSVSVPAFASVTATADDSLIEMLSVSLALMGVVTTASANVTIIAVQFVLVVAVHDADCAVVAEISSRSDSPACDPLLSTSSIISVHEPPTTMVEIVPCTHATAIPSSFADDNVPVLPVLGDVLLPVLVEVWS